MFRKKQKKNSLFGSGASFFPKRKKVGVAFSDYIIKDSFFGSSKKNYDGTYERSSVINFVPLFLLCLIFIILFIRLFYVNVVQGAYYTKLSNDNRTRTELISAPRGIIFDRMHRPLVRNVPVFEILDEKGKIKIIEKDEALDLIAKGKEIRNSIAREYTYKDLFSHVLGYTGQISEEELTQIAFKGYHLTDVVGKMGIEKTYEKMLHGINGRQLYEVDAAGEKIRELGSEDPVSGQDVVTTLDVDIQAAAKKAFEGIEKGAVVVSDPRTGGILALYSKPSFDPNVFTHSSAYKTDGKYDSVEAIILDSETQPLLDRAISGVYPPGSTYKLITAAAALETGAMKPDTEVEDTGVISVGGSTFGTWNYLQNGRKEGSLDVVGALKRSNDIYFYRAAEKVGVEQLSNFSKLFGLGSLTGIDLPTEAEGTVPGEKWKKRVLGEQWYLGDTYNMGIGQGYLETTPLQVNIMTQIVVNDGMVYVPHVLQTEKKVLKENLGDSKNFEVIKEGMRHACDTGGTAYPLFNFQVENAQLKIDDLDFFKSASDSAVMTRVAIGCKTGTAEAHGLGDPEPHAWLTVFAPFHNPEVVVTVLVENGGEGSSVAAPIAKEILEEYFKKKS